MDQINSLFKEFESINKPNFTKEEILRTIKRFIPDVQPELESNGIIINPETYCITIGEEKHSKLPKKEFQMLYYLISNKNKNVSRETILRHIWGDDTNVNERTVDVHITKLRKKFNLTCIKSNIGFGYMWIEK